MDNRLIQLIKKAAQEAVNAQKPMCFFYGIVISETPLQITIDQRLTLTEEFLDIPTYFTDHEVTIELNGIEQKYQVKNALKVGDKVTLLQQQGGQKFLILDRRIK